MKSRFNGSLQLIVALVLGCGVSDRVVNLAHPDASIDGSAGAGGSAGRNDAGGSGGRGDDAGAASGSAGQPDTGFGGEAGAGGSGGILGDAEPDGCKINACGGCGQLSAAQDTSCGRCGKYQCLQDKSDVSCVDPGLNACGGCGALAAAPDSSCGQCGKNVCSADKASVSCSDPGRNACNGCGVLTVAPGASCGACGTYVCSADKSTTVCNGSNVNACGGCGTLSAAPGASCGVCGSYVCSADKSQVTCVDAGQNKCGGCGMLAGDPSAPCGTCGSFACSQDKKSVSCADPGANACGGCGTLVAAPNSACGSCGKYVCKADNTAVICQEPGLNACGGCGALDGAPNSICGSCGKYVCSGDKTSVSCANVICGACQTCSAPGTCSTFPLNSGGTCSATQYCDGMNSSCINCPAPGPASGLKFVDPAYGTDDASHGGAYGRCAFKTLTYALAHATGQIALQATTYTQPTEHFPFVLTGTQQLLCKYMHSAPAIIQGTAPYARTLTSTAMALEGTANVVDGCSVTDVSFNGGSCVLVYSDGHSVINSDLGPCGTTSGVAFYVLEGVHNFSISSTRLHNSHIGAFLLGSNTGNMVNNIFAGDGYQDITCGASGDARFGNVTGSGNTSDYAGNDAGAPAGKPNCGGCPNCPF